MNSRSLQKVSIIVIGLLVLVGAAYYFATLFIKSSQQRVEIYSFPNEATITLNHENKGVESVFYLDEGSYLLTVSKEGFEEYTTTIQVTTKDEPYKIPVELYPVTDEARQWVEQNGDLYAEMNRIASNAAIDYQNEVIKQHPIISKLPFRNSLFRIGYVRDDDDNLTVTVYAPDVYVPYAVNLIREWGYSPEELNIDFVEQRSPFGE